ncbi:MAG: TraB/GumN family protein [Bacteroidales bacterium]|jgi:uncharacterized protein YbaP (TraB family)|nr:TraB/GumN family protein [Bacteroidales bacterium]
MKKTLAFAFIFAGFIIASFAQEKSLLWEVSKKNKKTSYLYGTVHIQDKRVFAFDEIVYEKLKSCDALAVELIIDEIDVEAMKEQMFLKEGLLKDYMTEAEYAMLDSVVKVKTGQSVAMFAKMKPFFLSSQLMQMDLPKDMPMALDMHFIDTARKMELNVIALEEISDQIGAIDKMSVEDQVSMLLDGLEDYDNHVGEQMTKLVDAYITQDLKAMHVLMQDTALPKEFGEELLVSRNYGMAKAVRKIMKKQSVFAAFGAAHLVGDEGVIALLRKKGYTVKPVNVQFDLD